MKIIKILKKNGSHRVIYCPAPDEMKRLKRQVDWLNEVAFLVDRHHVAHGFMPGRSPVTNAMAHRGYEYSLSFDLQDWFDTVTPDHVTYAPGVLCDQLRYCFVDGAARQGLPTSPALANIAAAPMDNAIMALRVRSRLGWSFGAYTRYADDLTFSFHLRATATWLGHVIPPIVERHRFKINSRKTKLQWAGAGRRIITGIAVDDDAHATRKIRRRLRAARHQRNWPQVQGLKEWSLLRLPHGYKPPPITVAEQILVRIETLVTAAGNFVRATFGRRIV